MSGASGCGGNEISFLLSVNHPRENLLSTLLQLTLHLLKGGPAKAPGPTLGSQLASSILKVRKVNV